MEDKINYHGSMLKSMSKSAKEFRKSPREGSIWAEAWGRGKVCQEG